MEPIAVNRVTITRELFEESHAAVFSVRRQKMLIDCGLVFIAFGLILMALQARLPAASTLCVSALLSGVIVLMWGLNLKRSELRRRYRAFAQKNGSASERTVACYSTFLTVDSGRGEPVQIDYEEIEACRETEHLILLICRDHTGVQLSKAGFEHGTWEAVADAIGRAGGGIGN